MNQPLAGEILSVYICAHLKIFLRSKMFAYDQVLSGSHSYYLSSKNLLQNELFATS